MLFLIMVTLQLFQLVSSYPLPSLSIATLSCLQHLPIQFRLTPNLRLESKSGTQHDFGLKLKGGLSLNMESQGNFEALDITFRVDVLVQLDGQPEWIVNFHDSCSAAKNFFLDAKRQSVPVGLWGLKIHGGERLFLSITLL